MKKDRCIVIPAIKKNAIIPDQLIKKLAGKTLIQRAIDTAKKIVTGNDIYVVTDSEEISLICQRNGIEYYFNQKLKLQSSNLIQELKFFIETQTLSYTNIILYRAIAPLVTDQDIQDGYDFFVKEDADILVTLKKERQRIWKKNNRKVGHLIRDMEIETIHSEIKSFLILKSATVYCNEKQHKIIPHYLGEKDIEINNYQDWWICEKLLQQKRIVFVVTGYPEVGLGHVYRALTIAHEISDHRCMFLCTKESQLAVKKITEKDYYTILQKDSLIDGVLKLKPDLVINDILNTEYEYINTLKERGIQVVNFEDVGPGSHLSDLVINSLYKPDRSLPGKYLLGTDYFCLRDEFIGCPINPFRGELKNLLITFGGTDPGNLTLKTLLTIQSSCIENDIKIYIVTGPGYMHKQLLSKELRKMDSKHYEYIDKTGIMSSIMEKVDCAISGSGRTVLELAHMKIPSIIMSQHEREHTHTFGRPENGFVYLGIMQHFDAEKLMRGFRKCLDISYRRELYNRMKHFDFEENKKKLVHKILSLLEVE